MALLLVPDEVLDHVRRDVLLALRHRLAGLSHEHLRQIAARPNPEVCGNYPFQTAATYYLHVGK